MIERDSLYHGNVGYAHPKTNPNDSIGLSEKLTPFIARANHVGISVKLAGTP